MHYDTRLCSLTRKIDITGGVSVHAFLSENKDKPLFYKGLQAKLEHF